MITPRPVEMLLQDILEWGGRIERYIGTMDFPAFQGDPKTQDAVIRCFEAIGEASAQILKLASDFQDKHPELELRQAYRARNRTAHGYGSVNIESVWRSAVDAVPRMIAATRKLADEMRL